MHSRSRGHHSEKAGTWSRFGGSSGWAVGDWRASGATVRHTKGKVWFPRRCESKDINALKRLQEKRALVALRLEPGAGQKHACCYQRVEIPELLVGGGADAAKPGAFAAGRFYSSKGRILLSGRRAPVRSDSCQRARPVTY